MSHVRYAWVAVATILCGCSLGAAQDADVDQLRRVHEGLNRAVNSRDVDAVVASFHPEAVIYGMSTVNAIDYATMDEAQRRERWQARFESGDSYTVTLLDPQYRIIGDTGIVWGHSRADIKPKEEPPRTVHTRFIHVYVRSGSTWLDVAWHASPVPGQ